MRQSPTLSLAVMAVTAAAFAAGMVRAGDWPLAARTDLTVEERSRVAAILAPPTDFSKAESFEALPGGAATSLASTNRDAFSHPSANMAPDDELRFHMGRALFQKLWVAAPSSTQASDGLGPLFNARSCETCHQRDGRGHPPTATGDSRSFFFRLARPARTEAEKASLEARQVPNLPDPTYGTQLQDNAIPGLPAEGRVRVTYQEKRVALSGGEVVALRLPNYGVDQLAYGPLDPGTTLSPRLTPPMIGLGLIEAIHPADIQAHADPDDRDGDGISGRVSDVIDQASGQPAIGRFGWKAQNATVAAQSAAALAFDVGISSPLVRRSHGDCQPAQKACLDRPTGIQPRLGDTEAPGPILDLLTFYAENLAVPARRNPDAPEVLAGKRVFKGLGCAACHVPNYVTRRDAAISTLGYQLIWPYSDFLLHDMGEDLADGQQVGDATGREWRTPALWGIGLTETINGHSFFLHDGRARSLTEAILWHGGEGQKARDAFASANVRDRHSLLTFLESL